MTPRVILFLLALLALPIALIAVLRSGRRAPAARSTVTKEESPAPEPPSAAEAAALAAPTAPPREVGAAFHELAFGVPWTPPSSQAVHREVAAAVDVLLTGPAPKPQYAPRRPLLLPKIVQAANDENVSRRELAVLIAQDPALAGTLLRLANSAFYRLTPEPVESVDRAVAVLGTQGIRTLVAAALLQPVFKTDAGTFRRFPEVTWEHTQYAATAAEAFAAVIADEDPFAAQLLALLSGLATILSYRASLDEYSRRGVAPDAATVGMIIEQYSPAVAARIAKDWELSSRMFTALEEDSPYTRAETLSGLGQALRFGRLCGRVAALRHATRLDDEAALAALRSGGYPGPAVERIWARLAKQLANQSQPL